MISAALCGRVTNPNNVPRNAVLLSKVKSLTVRAGQQTASRRVSPVPQLQCVGPAGICSLYTIDVMRCINEGSGYRTEDVEWSCKAFLPEELKLGSTDVSCEGYASSDDPYILKGSCGVEYRLLLTDKGEERYGRPDDTVWKLSSRKSEDIANFLFWVVFLGVLFIICYSIYQAYRNEGRGQGGRGAGYSGGGGGGPYDDPPPPYDSYPRDRPQPKKPRAYTPRTHTSSRTTPAGNAGNQQGWRPGFWTGTAAGAAAGYMFGSRNQRQARRETQQRTAGGIFGAGGGSSSWNQRIAIWLGLAFAYLGGLQTACLGCSYNCATSLVIERIALSAKETRLDCVRMSPLMPGPRGDADLTDEDEDLKLAIELSLREQEKTSTANAESTCLRLGSKGLSGLDRKAMEAERLARLKRKREDESSVTASGGSMKTATVRDQQSISPRPTGASSVPPKMIESTAPPYATKKTANPTVRLYHEGIVLKTYAAGYSSDRTITFADLIAPESTLKSSLLSSFVWDFDWLFPHFNTKRTNFLLVMQAKYPRDRQQIENDFVGIENIRVCFPPMEGQVNCMHSKLMLLFWDDRCRIVVPTANLTGVDWGVGSVMENMVWLIDLPRLLDPVHERSSTSEIPFKKSLKTFLSAQTVPGEILSKLDLFDFRKTRRVGFVHSIGGSHTGNEWRQTGHCGLGTTVSEMGLADEGPIEVDFVTSSVGSLNDKFMRSMYLAMRGDDGLTELMLRSTKSQRESKTGQNIAKGKSGQDWRGRFRFYFPSLDVVKVSNGGPSCAGTICFSEKWWESQTFPRAQMRDCVSVRDGLLMHNKVILVRYCNPKQTNEGLCMGYAYIGSANLSESAWGRLVQGTTPQGQKDGAAKQNLRNWEAGIILPFFETSGDVGLAKAYSDKLQDFVPVSHTVPIPMEFPARTYESCSLKPWFFSTM
ncbi:hypothetical protein DV736_g541, partial [Chaetothyriales sp. CBS 134916]